MHLKDFPTSALTLLLILVAASLGLICFGFVKTYIDRKILAKTLAGNIFIKYLATSHQGLIITSALELMIRDVFGIDIFLINWMAKLFLRSLILMSILFVFATSVFGFVEQFRPNDYINLSHTKVKALGATSSMLSMIFGVFAHVGWCDKDSWTICPFDKLSYLIGVSAFLAIVNLFLIIGLLIQKSVICNSVLNTFNWNCGLFESSQVYPVQANLTYLVTVSGNIQDAGGTTIPSKIVVVSPATHLLSFLMVSISDILVRCLCKIFNEDDCREVGIGFYICLMVLPVNAVIWVIAREEIRKHAGKTLRRWLAIEELY